MTLFTIGFTKKTAKQFFELLRKNNMEILLDIRLNNKSQLAGFSKGDDLQFFLPELCHCDYLHCLEFAPTKEILDAYKKKQLSWNEYESQYTALIKKRAKYLEFYNRFENYSNVCLLCSEPAPEQCHRRLLAEMIADTAPRRIEIKHI
ncbi:MAG: DUF488 domain-containing protein [Oscillospiraceae bacterium]|nr:DUF488 domain-containing protein [Oscillospiraceae bacterium]